MIRLQAATGSFNYRIVGVAVRGDEVLLHRAVTDDFWALPGGRAELREPAEATLRREMREELDVEVRVECLLWVVENFFTFRGVDHHELALYFLMGLPPGSAPATAREPFRGDEDGLELVFRWFPVAGLDRIRLYPTFLRESLRSLPATPVHVVHTDPTEGPLEESQVAE
jgi:ADP-ribose pyrophosphatase YjhB (NUDIX family)